MRRVLAILVCCVFLTPPTRGADPIFETDGETPASELGGLIFLRHGNQTTWSLGGVFLTRRVKVVTAEPVVARFVLPSAFQSRRPAAAAGNGAGLPAGGGSRPGRHALCRRLVGPRRRHGAATPVAAAAAGRGPSGSSSCRLPGRRPNPDSGQKGSDTGWRRRRCDVRRRRGDIRAAATGQTGPEAMIHLPGTILFGKTVWPFQTGAGSSTFKRCGGPVRNSSRPAVREPITSLPPPSS